MSDQQTVTWLMAVRNGMPYLPQTLASIEQQTYPHHKLLVWDNGSTDGTQEELRRWIPSRLQGRVIEDKPLGLGASLAALVDLADTELCARIDADDLNNSHRLERQVAAFSANSSLGVLGGQASFIDENGRQVEGWANYPTGDAEVRWRTRWMCSLLHPAVMFRKSVIVAVGNYKDCRPYEDHDLWIRASAKAEIANLPDTLLSYRRINTSVTGAVQDFVPFFAKAADMNGEALFPGFASKDAMSLWRAAFPQYGVEYKNLEPIRLSHIRSLPKAAQNLAAFVGKPADYFQNTDVFRLQQHTMKQDWLNRTGFQHIARLKRKLTGG